MTENKDSAIIREVYRILREQRANLSAGEEETPGPGRELTPTEVYDCIVELLPLAEATVHNRPEFKAYREVEEHRAAQAIAQGEEVDRVRPIFRVAGQLYCMTDKLEYNWISIARFNVNEEGKPTSIAEEFLIYGGVEGSEDPLAQQPQRISYRGPNLFRRDPQNPNYRYSVDNTDRVEEEIRGFLDKLAKA